MQLIEHRNQVGKVARKLNFQLRHIMEKLSQHDTMMTKACAHESNGDAAACEMFGEDARAQLRLAICTLCDVLEDGPEVVKTLKLFE